MLTIAFAAVCLSADPVLEDKVLAKGDGFLVHAIRAGPLARGDFGDKSYGRDIFNQPGKYVITHLDTTTGKITRLHAGGDWGNPLVLGGIDRSFRYRQFLWGVAADEHHLYLLLGRTREVTEYLGERGRTTRTPSTVIQVIRLKDAALVQEVPLAKALHEETETLTYDRLDRVALTITKDGLVVGDEKEPRARFRFGEGRTLEPATQK